MIATAFQLMTPLDWAVVSSLGCLGFFCAGMAIGLWRRHRIAAEQYRLGRKAGFSEAHAMYAKSADMLMGAEFPTLKARDGDVR